MSARFLWRGGNVKTAYIPEYCGLFYEARVTFFIINTDLKYIVNRPEGWRSVLQPCPVEKVTLPASSPFKHPQAPQRRQ